MKESRKKRKNVWSAKATKLGRILDSKNAGKEQAYNIDVFDPIDVRNTSCDPK